MGRKNILINSGAAGVVENAERALNSNFSELYNGASSPDIAAILADTGLQYQTEDTPHGSVAEGDYIMPFCVAASDASDHHATTAGGVKLYEAGPNFSTRARAAAAWVRMVAASETVADGTIWSWPGASIVYDGSATALSDFAGWSPRLPLVLEHFGISGDANTSENNLPDEATTDVTTALQAAFDYAVENGLELRGDPGRVYGVSDTVIFGYRSALSGALSGARLVDVSLSALSSVNWTSGDVTDPDPSVWTFGNAVLVVGRDTALSSGKYPIGTERVFVNCHRRAAVGIHYFATASAKHEKCAAYRATEAQIRTGKIGGTSSDQCTDTDFINIGGNEFQYTTDPADGYNDLTVRTAAGLHHSSADCRFYGGTFSASKHSLALGEFSNTTFFGSKFWNGPVRTDVNSRTAVIGSLAQKWNFNGCRFDDGQVRLLKFNGSFVGNQFIQFSAADQFALEATSASETAEDLVFIGNDLDDSAALLTTSGFGSWATVRATVMGNKVNGSTNYFTIDGVASRLGGGSWFGNTGGTITGSYGLDLVTYSQDYFELRGERGIGLMADANANSAASQSIILLGADNDWKHRMGSFGHWEFFYNDAPGGGPVMTLSRSGDDFILVPSDGAGGIDTTKQLEYDYSAGVWATLTPFKALTTTVSGLPAAGTAGAGARAVVTDATATTFASTVTGGGANTVPVYSDGTNWLVG